MAEIVKDFAARTERVPSATGGFVDDHQLVVHHTANVPPGYTVAGAMTP